MKNAGKEKEIKYIPSSGSFKRVSKIITKNPAIERIAEYRTRINDFKGVFTFLSKNSCKVIPDIAKAINNNIYTFNTSNF
ncbi:hypothetical protein [Sulfuracidifex tepidarius]|uniref:hypothetical protein n=1 Tax=Sulfuracidifex tepidarius TaxID=1294262 RepID=UPI0011F2D036|nr:hypothetical protein [Sulfuracidifex tepidarius]